MIGVRRTNPEQGGTLQVILAIIGGLVLFCLVAVLAGLWAVKRLVQVEVTRSGGTERVEIRTPIGDLEVRQAQDIAEELKLPIYPGAEPEEESASVRLRGRLWLEEGGLDVSAAKFTTEAEFDTVDAWYRENLGAEFTREKGKIEGGDDRHDGNGWKIRVEPGGDDVLFSRQREGRARGVALGREAGHTTIMLFEVYSARRQ